MKINSKNFTWRWFHIALQHDILIKEIKFNP